MKVTSATLQWLSTYAFDRQTPTKGQRDLSDTAVTLNRQLMHLIGRHPQRVNVTSMTLQWLSTYAIDRQTPAKGERNLNDTAVILNLCDWQADTRKGWT